MTFSCEPAPAGHKCFLKARFVIGSCKGPIDFKPTENVFHMDDIPPAKKAKKKEVIDWKKNKILSLTRSSWNFSTQTDKLIPVKCSATNLEYDRSNTYQYNYRAEVLPAKNLEPVHKSHKMKVWAMTDAQKARIRDIKSADPVMAGRLKRTQEMPTNPKLQGKKAWAVSTVMTKDELRAMNTRLAQASSASAARSKARLTQYESPVALYHRVLEEIRAAKRQVREGEARTPKVRHVNRLAKEPDTKFISYEHSGVWEFNKHENEWMWSDTGSTVKESEGDVQLVHDPSKWCYDGL